MEKSFTLLNLSKYPLLLAIILMISITSCTQKNSDSMNEDNLKLRSPLLPEKDYEKSDVEFMLKPRILEIPSNESLSIRNTTALYEFARKSYSRKSGTVKIAWPANMEVYSLTRKISDILVKGGIQISQIVKGSYSPQERGGRDSIVIWYNEVNVAPKAACFGTSTKSNLDGILNNTGYGCASMHNLSVMVSNPLDLIEPHPYGKKIHSNKTEGGEATE